VADEVPSSTRHHIALVGLSGTGKTSVAPLLALRRHLAVVDLDLEIGRRAGRTAAELLEEEGEDAFRDAESAELERALRGPAAVIATGGGVVLRPANRERLRRGAAVVWLSGDPDALAARVVHSHQRRPLLGDDPATALRRLAAERDPLYLEVADVVVPVDDLTPDGIADRLDLELSPSPHTSDADDGTRSGTTRMASGPT
jgi:shikimate kinase